MLYEVTMKTKPGMYAQYESTKTVNAFDEEEATYNAWMKIKREGFQDHTRNMWNVVCIICIG